MDDVIQLVSDGDGLAVIGEQAAVERFFLEQGLDRLPAKNLDLQRLAPLAGTGSAAARVGSELAASSGRWVKLTKESADAVRKLGLTPTKTPGVSHAMIGPPGRIKQWIQIDGTAGALLGGPMALAAVSTMMQQQALQHQIDQIVEYLQEIDEKVDDILRGQKDAVLADMIGVDLLIEEALTVRDEVGRVSEITWSKVQATSMTIARTQAYALRQLDAIAEKLEKKADPGDIAKATREAEPKIREWLVVIARCCQLQDGVTVLELDRVLDSSPDELDRHMLGLANARQNRRELIAGNTNRLLSRMDEIVRTANSKVLFNPFDSPAAVQSSNQVAAGLLDFRGRLGIDSSRDVLEAKRWGQAAAEARDKALATTADGVETARRLGAATLDHAAQALRSVDTDGDGVPDKPRVLAVAGDAGSAIKGAAAEVIGSGVKSASSAVAGAATGVSQAMGSLRRRKRQGDAAPDEPNAEGADEVPEPPQA